MMYGRMLSAVLLLLQLGLASSLRFDLSGPVPKCLSEDIQTNVVVLADYRVITDDSHNTMNVKVTSPYGTILHNAEAVQTGRFAFTTTEPGIHVACFWPSASLTGVTLHVELDWKIGVAAKDWDAVAKRDRIEGIDLELVKLHEAVESIRYTLLYMKQREKEMRNVNERTNARVAWFGIASMFVCLAATAWQLCHLRSFFERKKLL